MGADQSSTARMVAKDERKICYYELLGLERQATNDEIKSSYRKKALELHPDRNYDDVQNTTKQFAEIQTAYEILSNPQEKAWYDSHRDAILRGIDPGTGVNSKQDTQFTSAAQIASLVGKFNTRVPFTDSPNGFFGRLRDVFGTISREEDAACEEGTLDVVDYPGFGSAEDHYEAVKLFYKIWQNFSTKKSFSWKDLYAPSTASDRATRRLIDKENRKSREDGIREFNDAVRYLVAFVRKRDPRYVPKAQTDIDRQKMLREAAAAQAARSRAANRAKMDMHPQPSWVGRPRPDEYPNPTESDESEEAEAEQLECVICGKFYKSEKQFEAHEKSKKHLKAIQQSTKQRKQEEMLVEYSSPTFSVDRNVGGSDSNPISDSESEVTKPGSTTYQPITSHVLAVSKAKVFSQEQEPILRGEISSEDIDQYASGARAEDQLLADKIRDVVLDKKAYQSAACENTDNPVKQQLGKAKAKRARKAAQQTLNSPESQEFDCASCHNAFPSKTKLFDHIKKLGHAQPVPITSKVKRQSKH